MVTSINDKQIIHISSGGEFNVAMDSEYSLWVWGKNEFGQVNISSVCYCIVQKHFQAVNIHLNTISDQDIK